MASYHIKQDQSNRGDLESQDIEGKANKINQGKNNLVSGVPVPA